MLFVTLIASLIALAISSSLKRWYSGPNTRVRSKELSSNLDKSTASPCSALILRLGVILLFKISKLCSTYSIEVTSYPKLA